jgi:hypothetical protein
MEVNYRKGIKHEKERTVNNPPFFDLQFTIFYPFPLALAFPQ